MINNTIHFLIHFRNVNKEFKNIRREFPLVCNPGTSRDVVDENEEPNSGIDTMNKSCDNVTPDGTNETDGIATSTVCSRR